MAENDEGFDPLADLKKEFATEQTAVETEAAKVAADKGAKAVKAIADADAEAGGDPAAAKTAKEVAADAAVDGDADAEAADDKKKPVVVDKTAKRDWKRDRINELTAKNKEKDAEIARLAAEIANKPAAAVVEDEAAEELDAEGKPKPKAKPAKIAVPAKSEAQIREEIRAEERVRGEREQFTRDSNAAFDAGVKAYGEDGFEEATSTLNALGLNAGIVAVALATDAPERVLYMLAQDPDEATRIFALPQLRMATAMAKIASSRPRAVKQSDAPKPLTPLGGNGQDTTDDFGDNASDAVIERAVSNSLKRIAEKYNN